MTISPLAGTPAATGAGPVDCGTGTGARTGGSGGASIAWSASRTAISRFISSTLANPAAPGPSPDRDVDDEHDEQEQEGGAPRLLGPRVHRPAGPAVGDYEAR